MAKRKSLSIPLFLTVSIFLFMTSAFADGCEGGDGCFRCVQMDHRHAAIPETGYMPVGCQSGTPNSACGIAAGSVFDGQGFLISGIRAENHQDSGATAGPANACGAALLPKKNFSPHQAPLVTTAPPIYLSNLTLLC